MTRTSRPFPLRAASAFVAVAALGALAACSGDAEEKKEVAVGGTALFDTLPENIQEAGSVSFGALWETPPVISVTATDTSNPVGITPDLGVLMGEQLGVAVEWQNLQWPAQLPGVQSGTVDALFGQVTATAEREQSVVDLVPFSKTTMGLVLADDRATGVDSLADMCGETIAVPVGSIQTEEVDAASAEFCDGDDIGLKEFQGATLAVNALRSGAVDAWFDNYSNLVEIAKADTTLDAVELPAAEIAPTYNALAISKDAPELTEALLAAMRAIVEDGTYAEVFADHGFSAGALTLDEVVANPVTGSAVGSTD